MSYPQHRAISRGGPEIDPRLDPDFRPPNAENLIDILEDRMRSGQFSGDIPASVFEKAHAEIFEQIQEVARTPEAYACSMPHPLGREIPKGVWLKGGRGLAEDLLKSDVRVSLVIRE